MASMTHYKLFTNWWVGLWFLFGSFQEDLNYQSIILCSCCGQGKWTNCIMANWRAESINTWSWPLIWVKALRNKDRKEHRKYKLRSSRSCIYTQQCWRCELYFQTKGYIMRLYCLSYEFWAQDWISVTLLGREVASNQRLASFPVLVKLVTMVRWAELKYPVCHVTYWE